MKPTQFAALMICSTVAICLSSAPAIASGGIYLSNIRITNDGNVVLADDFRSGRLQGWTGLECASVVIQKPNTPGILYLNAHSSNNSGYSASAWHSLNVGNPGLVEMSLAIYVAPAQEQYVWQQKRDNCLCYIKFFSMGVNDKTESQVAQIGVQLNKNEEACRLYVYSQTGPNAMNGQVDMPVSNTKTPVLPTGKWVTLHMRMDPLTSTLSLMMDDKTVVSTPYEPTKVHNIGRFGILSAFGDGAAMSSGDGATRPF